MTKEKKIKLIKMKIKELDKIIDMILSVVEKR
jgi:hypothetical protein